MLDIFKPSHNGTVLAVEQGRKKPPGGQCEGAITMTNHLCDSQCLTV